MSEFGLVKSFGIDNGELDGESPQTCFVLGYELAMIDEALKAPDAISRLVHSQNADRIAESCKKANRQHQFIWHPDDVSEAWLQLEVAPNDFSESPECSGGREC